MAHNILAHNILYWHTTYYIASTTQYCFSHCGLGTLNTEEQFRTQYYPVRYHLSILLYSDVHRNRAWDFVKSRWRSGTEWHMMSFTWAKHVVCLKNQTKPSKLPKWRKRSPIGFKLLPYHVLIRTHSPSVCHLPWETDFLLSQGWELILTGTMIFFISLCDDHSSIPTITIKFNVKIYIFKKHAYHIYFGPVFAGSKGTWQK